MPPRYQEIAIEPQKDESDLTATEIEALTSDWDKINEYLTRVQQPPISSRKEADLFNHVHHSPILVSSLTNQDWGTYFGEVAKYGITAKDFQNLCQWVCDRFEENDLESISLLYKRLAGSRSSDSDEYFRHPTRAENLSNTFYVVAYNLKKAQDEKKIFDTKTQKLISSYRENADQEILTLRESEIRDQTYTIIRRDLWRKISNIYSKKGSNYFPETVSSIFRDISQQKLFEQLVEKKEFTRELALSNLRNNRFSLESLDLLTSIDPANALSEATAVGKRRRVVVNLAEKYPDVFIEFYSSEQFTSNEVIEGVKVLSNKHPHLLLTNFAEFDCPNSVLIEAIANALQKEDIVSILELSTKSDQIKEFCDQSDIQDVLFDRISGIFEEDDHKGYLTFHLLYGNLGLAVLRSEKYLEKIQYHLDAESKLFQSELSKMGDINDPLFIESLSDRSLDELGWEYRKFSEDYFSKYPNELRDIILITSFIEPSQPSSARFAVSESIHNISLDHLSSFNRHSASLILSKCFQSWGYNLPSLSLLGLYGLESYPAEDFSNISRSIKYVLTHLDEVLEDVYVTDDWGGGGEKGSLEDKKDLLYQKLINLSGLVAKNGDMGLVEMYADLAGKDIKFLDKFNSLSENINYPSKFFSKDQISKIIFEYSSLSERIYALKAFEGGNSELLEEVFSISRLHFDELKEFTDYRQFIKFSGLYYGYDIDQRGSRSLVQVCNLLDETDWKVVGDNIDKSTYDRFASHLILVKALESIGIPKDKAYIWGKCASNMYEDPEYFSTIDSSQKKAIIEINNLLRNRNIEILKFISENNYANWLEGAPKTLEILIGSESSAIFESVNILASSLQLDVEEAEKLQKLFKLKDLKHGSYSRRFIYGSLLQLSSYDDGIDVAKSLVSSLSLSKDDPKRLRTIFRLSEIVSFEELILENRYIHDIRNQAVQKTSEKIKTMLFLADSEASRLDINIENIQTSGLLSAFVSLSENYKHQGYEKSSEVLHEIYRHILLGDFRQWRNSTAATLGPWLNSAEGDIDEAYIYSYTDMRNTAISMLGDVIYHLKNHRLEEAIESITMERFETKIKNLDDIKFLVKVFRDIRHTKDYSMADTKQLSSRCAQASRILNTLGETQSANDMRQIVRALSKKVDTAKKIVYRSIDSDDPVDLINSGIYPQETCQSWRDGMFNECLVSTVANPETRILNIVDDQNMVCGRVLMKRRKIQREEKVEKTRVSVGRPFDAVLLETIYSVRADSTVRKLIFITAVKKARMCKLPLILGSTHLKEEEIEFIKSLGGSVTESHTRLIEEQVYGESAYSDSFGGKINPGDIDISGHGYIITFENDEQD